jgi:hypothetical protein
MEHKHDQVIREKLESLAYPSMSWRKEEVWLKIEQNSAPRPTISWIYRAAAIFVALTSVLIFSQQVWDHQQSEKKISQLENKLLLQEPLVRLSTTPIASTICIPEEPSAEISSPKADNRSFIKQPAPKVITATEALNISDSLPSVALIPDVIHETQPDESPVPIILGAEPPVIYPMSKRDKRMRMKLFKQVEPKEVMAQSHDRLFISRTKKH